MLFIIIFSEDLGKLKWVVLFTICQIYYTLYPKVPYKVLSTSIINLCDLFLSEYTILAIIFSDFLTFYQTFLSSQVKQIVIISNKHGVYELPHEFPNDLRPRILGNQEILIRSQIFTELQPSAQSSSQNENFVNTRKELFKN